MRHGGRTMTTVTRPNGDIAAALKGTRPGGLPTTETTSKNFSISHNSRKCQKSFPSCFGGLFASTNWLTTFATSSFSVTWHGGKSKEVDDFFVFWDDRFSKLRVIPPKSLLPQWDFLGVFCFGLYLLQNPLYFWAHPSKVLANIVVNCISYLGTFLQSNLPTKL